MMGELAYITGFILATVVMISKTVIWFCGAIIAVIITAYLAKTYHF